MTDSRAIIDRSQRLYHAETAGRTVHIPGRTISHLSAGGGSGVIKAYCNQDAPAGNVITCWGSYDELYIRIWSASITFRAGHLTSYDQAHWLSLQNANINHMPETGSWWEEITDYNEEAEYASGDWCLYQSKLWRSKVGSNTGNIPAEGVYWTCRTADYAAGTTYEAGERARYDSKLWRSLVGDNLGNTPAEGAYWTEVSSIDVYCNIACGKDLNLAFPLLQEQLEIEVRYNSSRSRYECTTLFQATEETCAEGGMMEMANDLLVVDVANSSDSSYVDAGSNRHGLIFEAYANSTYRVEMMIIYSATADATGIKLQLKGPASPVSVHGVFYGFNDDAFTGKVFDAFEDSVTFSKNSSGVKFVRCEALIQTGDTAGEVKLQFASGVYSSEVKILIGSTINYRRLYYDSSPAE